MYPVCIPVLVECFKKGQACTERREMRTRGLSHTQLHLICATRASDSRCVLHAPDKQQVKDRNGSEVTFWSIGVSQSHDDTFSSVSS